MEGRSQVCDWKKMQSINLNLLETKFALDIRKIANNGRLGIINSTKYLWIDEVLEAVESDIHSANGSDESIFDTNDDINSEIVETKHLLRQTDNVRREKVMAVLLSILDKLLQW